MRTFLKTTNNKNIPIQAIGLSLYEELGLENSEEKLGKEVVRTQWLDFSTLGSTVRVNHMDDLNRELISSIASFRKENLNCGKITLTIRNELCIVF